MSYSPDNTAYNIIPVIEEIDTGNYETYEDRRIRHDNKNNKMKFNDYKDSEEKYGIAGGDDWMNLEEGDNKLRIVSEFIDYGEHFDNAKKRSYMCLGKGNCSYCDAGEKPKVRYLGWVIDRKDNKVKLLRFGHSIFKQIGALAVNDEYKFDEIPNYDITIKREGTGLDTEYHVTAARKDSKITVEESEEIDAKVKDVPEIIENMKAKREKEVEEAGGEIIDEPEVKDEPLPTEE